MKKIAIYGEVIDQKHYDFIKGFFKLINELSFEYVVYSKYASLVKEKLAIDIGQAVFSKSEELVQNNTECVISIGGDGSMLNSFRLIFNTDIKVIGINTGRLGFLSNVSTDQVEWVMNELSEDRFIIKERSVLEINILGEERAYFAVNEVTIHKQDTSSMLTIHCQIDQDFVNSYWADGVIVCTPTGSTAYSLSCGGPILMPGSNNFMITPIAPHNLTVRPIVFSDEKSVQLRVESRSGKFLLAMDSTSIALSVEQEVHVKKADFVISLLKFSDYNYFNTLRSKLMWGADKRN